MADDWGCGSQSLGGFSFDSSKTLHELVEGLSTRKDNVEMESFPLAPSQSENVRVKVVPCVNRKKNTAPKILKKKSTINKEKEEPNLKRVTFEVSQFLAHGSSGCSKDEARDRLVVALGGLPPKKKQVSYKAYKLEQAAKKEASSATGFADLSRLCVPHRGIKKNKKKR